MKRKELEDIFSTLDVKDYGFKNEEELENLKREEKDLELRKTKINRIIIGIIIVIQFIILFQVEIVDTIFVVFVLLDFLICTVLMFILDDIFKLEQKDMLKLRKYKIANNEYKTILSSDLRIQAETTADMLIEYEKNGNESLLTFIYNANRELFVDIVMVELMKDMDFSHESILKVIDKMLIPNIENIDDNGFYINIIIPLLKGANVISEKEELERNFYYMELLEQTSNLSFGIVSNNNRLLLEKNNKGIYKIPKVTRKIEKENIKEKLINYIEEKTNTSVNKINIECKKTINLNNRIVNSENVTIEDMQKKRSCDILVYNIELKKTSKKELNNEKLKWVNVNNLSKNNVEKLSYDILNCCNFKVQ